MERSGHQRLVIALASGLGVALLAIAFLLGRMSSSPAVVTVTAPATTSASTSTTTTNPTLPTPASPPIDVPSAPPEGEAPPATVSPASIQPLTNGVPAPSSAAPLPLAHPLSADQQQIAAYFNQVDRIEDMGAGDPQTYAASMVQAMSSGDFSGFDDLLAKARAQRQRLQSISPPRACVEHHRLALSLSADSVAMLERLKAALIKGDATALMTVATEGKTLETQTSQLKAMADAIKRQAGL